MFAPAGLTLKVTPVTPEPVTVAVSVTVPLTEAPGSARRTAGAVAFTVTVTVEPVKLLPALSVITGRRS